jgi:formate--tetrahydrofolate ligase
MAIVCLSKDINDLKRRLGNIIIGYNEENEPVYAKDIKAEGAMAVLLKDAINPNLVQSLEHTPCLIHGGPFANIAHGCNSIRATSLALKLGDYVVTEAGFGSDLGAEKFLDIKCRKTGLKPDLVVVVATIKALKYHGGALKENILNKDNNALLNGMENLFKHVNNMKDEYGLNVIVALNRYNTDTEEEIEIVQKELKKQNIEMSLVEGWAKGGEGAIDIAQKVVELVEHPTDFKFIYNDDDSIKTKIEKVATKIYGATGVNYLDEANENIEKIEKLGKSNLLGNLLKDDDENNNNNINNKNNNNILIKQNISPIFIKFSYRKDSKPKKNFKKLNFDFLGLKKEEIIIRNLEDEYYNPNDGFVFSEMIKYIDPENDETDCILFITQTFLYLLNKNIF